MYNKTYHCFCHNQAGKYTCNLYQWQLPLWWHTARSHTRSTLHIGPEKMVCHAQLKPLTDRSTVQKPPF